MLIIMEPTSSYVVRKTPMMHLTPDAQSIGGFDHAQPAGAETADKWPVWLRILTIVGLSALLWYGIISAIMALL